MATGLSRETSQFKLRKLSFNGKRSDHIETIELVNKLSVVLVLKHAQCLGIVS